jgi:hypothetical protein
MKRSASASVGATAPTHPATLTTDTNVGNDQDAVVGNDESQKRARIDVSNNNNNNNNNGGGSGGGGVTSSSTLETKSLPSILLGDAIQSSTSSSSNMYGDGSHMGHSNGGISTGSSSDASTVRSASTGWSMDDLRPVGSRLRVAVVTQKGVSGHEKPNQVSIYHHHYLLHLSIDMGEIVSRQ